MSFDRKEFNEAYAVFIKNMQSRLNAHYAENFPSLVPDVLEHAGGRKYFKVISKRANGGGASVQAFVNTETGDIYMPASWKAPALNGARGNIFFNNGDDALTDRGSVRYAR